MESRAPTPPQPSASSDRIADLMASVVVFLVALPLCIGLAMASGVPAERGLVTGMVGGIVVGIFTGSPLLVSGPAASLLVLVWDLVATHGLDMLGPVVVGAGLVQVLAGFLGIGRWFRAAAPAVIQGMMTGIGVLIVASQLHVMIDSSPGSSFTGNLASLPGAVKGALAAGSAAPWVGLGTLVLLFGWKSLRPERLSLVPPQLVAVVGAVLACQFLEVQVEYLQVAGSFFQGLDLTTPADLQRVLEGGLLTQCLVFAFVASAATLLSATAVDQMQSRVQTDYDQELLAQGLGNTVAGGLGGLPMTGVIVRSSANVEAGATSRLSTILHGVWLLGFVALAPSLLATIPKATLGAILVAIGLNLASPSKMRALHDRDRTELGIGLVTLFGVVGLDLFSGILLGLSASILRLVYAFTHFEVEVREGDGTRRDVHLSGFATFLQVPRLAGALDSIPGNARVRAHLDALDYVDHACLEQLAAAERRLRTGGGSLTVEWEELTRRYKDGPGTSDAGSEQGARLLSLQRLVTGVQQVLGTSRPKLEKVVGHLEIDEDHVLVDLDHEDLSEALQTLLPPLLAEASPEALEDQDKWIRLAGRKALSLGQGVLLVHLSLPGIRSAHLSFGRMQQTLRPQCGSGDLVFVLLDGEQDAEAHLMALGCLARICASEERVHALRRAAGTGEIVELLRQGIFEAEAPGATPRLQAGSRLSVVETSLSGTPLESLERALERSFGVVVSASPEGGEHELYRLLSVTLSSRPDHTLLLVDVPPGQEGSLHELVGEASHEEGLPAPRVHFLNPTLDEGAESSEAG